MDNRLMQVKVLQNAPVENYAVFLTCIKLAHGLRPLLCLILSGFTVSKTCELWHDISNNLTF